MTSAPKTQEHMQQGNRSQPLQVGQGFLGRIPPTRGTLARQGTLLLGISHHKEPPGAHREELSTETRSGTRFCKDGIPAYHRQALIQFDKDTLLGPTEQGSDLLLQEWYVNQERLHCRGMMPKHDIFEYRALP